MATPSFTGLDVGLPGGALHPDKAQSTVVVQDGGLQVARAEFAMPGFGGVLAHSFGGRGRQVLWALSLVLDDLATLAEVGESIGEAQEAGSGTLVMSDGRSFDRVVLATHRPGRGWDTIRAGDLTDWIIRDDLLEFRVLST